VCTEKEGQTRRELASGKEERETKRKRDRGEERQSGKETERHTGKESEKKRQIERDRETDRPRGRGRQKAYLTPCSRMVWDEGSAYSTAEIMPIERCIRSGARSSLS